MDQIGRPVPVLQCNLVDIVLVSATYLVIVALKLGSKYQLAI